MDPKKILIVEDETFIADLYSRQLTNEGFAVSVANDGVSGLKTLEGQPFDLLLLDIMLPGMNGLELLKEWKSKNPGKPLQVLLLTNLGQDAVIKEGFALGASGYLIKASYTPAQIVTEVKNALAGKQAGSPNPAMGQTNSMAMPLDTTVGLPDTSVSAAPTMPEPTPVVSTPATTPPLTMAVETPSGDHSLPTSANMITASALPNSQTTPSVDANPAPVGPTATMPDANPATTTFQPTETPPMPVNPLSTDTQNNQS